jgi:hypothetical protein
MKKLEINPTTEFHILRHFLSVSEEYKRTLIGKKYYFFDLNSNSFIQSKISSLDIEKALQTKGGKFELTLSMMKTPKDVLEFCKTKIGNLTSLTWVIVDNCLKSSCYITSLSEIGPENIILKKNLSDDQLKKVKTFPRSLLPGEDKIMVQTIENYPTSTTKNIEVQLINTPDLPFIWVTAYPANNLKTNSNEEFWSQVVVVLK